MHWHVWKHVALYLYVQSLLIVLYIVSPDKVMCLLVVQCSRFLCVVTYMKAAFWCWCHFALPVKDGLSTFHKDGTSMKSLLPLCLWLQEVVGFSFVMWVCKLAFFVLLWFGCLGVSQGMSVYCSSSWPNWRGDRVGHVWNYCLKVFLMAASVWVFFTLCVVKEKEIGYLESAKTSKDVEVLY